MGSQQKESDPREREENDSRVDRGTFQGLLVKLCNIPSTSCEDLTIKFSDKRLKIDFIMTFIKKFKRRRFDVSNIEVSKFVPQFMSPRYRFQALCLDKYSTESVEDIFFHYALVKVII